MTETIPKGEKILYLDTSHVSNEHHDKYFYTHENRKVRVTREPNELFVKYEITEIGTIDTIVYKVDEKVHTFTNFASKVRDKKIEEIVVYFIRYNENPLYLSILTEDSKKNVFENTYERLNYKLDKNGVWEDASNYAYIFTDLNELAHKHDMLQYFEIDSTDKFCSNRNYPVKCGDLRAKGDKYGDYKIYTHTSKSDVGITTFFLYKNKLLKNLIVTYKKVNEVEVYYDKNDEHNTLPLLIVVHKLNDGKEFFVNEGGNYRWKKVANLTNYPDNDELLKILNNKREELMGQKIDLEIEDYYEHLNESQTHFQNLDILIQPHKEFGYRSIRFTDKHHKRFSISSLRYEGHDVEFPDLPIYSVLELYIFHHGSSTYPMFICAVYERTHHKIFVWYQLKESSKSKYTMCYYLSEDPKHFKQLIPIIKVIETQVYTININITKSILDSYSAGTKKLTLIDNHNFNVWYQKSHVAHNRFVITPAFSNYFTLESITIYDTPVSKEKYESVKEIHVFEHYNYHHYKVCIVTAKYNYVLELDDISLHWLEIRKNTNRGLEWQIVGRPKIEKSPDDFNNPYDISVLMDERISYYEGGKEVVYKKPDSKHIVPGLYVPYDTKANYEYTPGGKWPPAKLSYPVNVHPNLYSTYEYDPESGVITGTTPKLPGKEGGLTPLVGGLIGSGAGVGIVGVTTGYVLYSHMETITSALSSFFH